jgi:hypothetical protein
MGFKHRTFNDTDLLYFVSFFQFHYSKHASLETAFTHNMNKKDIDTENAQTILSIFFFIEDIPNALKHIHRLKNHLQARICF